MHKIQARSILSAEQGMNLYRGCTHGCIYCDSRSACYRMQHDFTDVEVKENALTLLADALSRRRKPCMVATGSMSDPYMPIEEELRLMRGALEVIDRYGCGIAVQTKSDRVLRDIDLYERIHHRAKAVVQMTLTTADDDLCRKIEPHVSSTSERFAALCRLRERGIPTVVWLSPILPLINDTEENLLRLLDLCAQAGVHGVICFGMGLTLRAGNREYFYQKLDQLFPGLRREYVRRYGDSYVAASPHNDRLMALFHETCQQAGLVHDNDSLFAYLRTLPQRDEAEQLSLWGL